MGKIILSGLEFKSPIGLHSFEKEQGNTIIIDIILNTKFDKASTDDSIEGTVDYEKVYKIIADIIEKPANLLEYVAEKIVEKILAEFESVRKVTLSVSKLNPPIQGKCKAATIKITRKRKKPKK